MKKHLLASTAAAAALTAPSYAGNYVTGFGGVNLLDNQNVHINAPLLTTGFGPYTDTNTNTSSSVVTSSWLYTYGGTKSLFMDFNGEYDFDNGFVIGAAMGCDIDAIPGLSVEGELAYRKNDFDLQGDLKIGYHVRKYVTKHNLLSSTTKYTSYQIAFSVNNFPTTIYFGSNTYYVSDLLPDGSGDVTSFSIMANVWYEFGTSGPIKPYVGGGVGWAKVEVDMGGASGDDSGLAWQLGLGVSYDLSDKTSLRLEYRRFQVNGLDITDGGVNLGFEDYEADNVIVGVKMKF
ncbi:MAG: porin family protein [Alphaproteobacteria bacterium]|nr:MAG: porin family protein [Alphaproteobacteria bacterium]